MRGDVVGGGGGGVDGGKVGDGVSGCWSWEVTKVVVGEVGGEVGGDVLGGGDGGVTIVC